MILHQDEMIAAMRRDDARYDGKFFVCVKTTGIYCLPSCKAKLPKIRNVIFVETREEAIAAGFRGCKRCRSEFFPHTEPEWFGRVMAALHGATERKLDERKLADIGRVDISTIRRYFKSYMRTTPLALHRRIRLEHAHRLIASGVDSLTAALAAGFESPSGFREAFLKRYGYPPSVRRPSIPSSMQHGT